MVTSGVGVWVSAGGVVGVLVQTGEATAEEAARCPEPPDIIMPSIRELGEALSKAAK